MQQDLQDAELLQPGEFAARVAWAAKRNSPLWLWPNVSPEDWQAALGSIERVTREVLVHGRAGDALQGSAEALGIAAYTSGMGPLLGHWAAEGRLVASTPVHDVLLRHYRLNSERMTLLAEHAARVVEGLSRSGIAVTVLKGMHTAFDVFPTPGCRPTSDIDLLIEPAAKGCAAHVLRALSYSPQYERKMPDEQFWGHASAATVPASLTLLTKEDPWGIDLHTSTNRRHSSVGSIIDMDRLAARFAPEPWRPTGCGRVLSPAANLLFIACHAGRVPGELRMIRLAELALLIRQAEAAGDFAWDEVAALGRSTETLPHAFMALALAAKLVPGLVPDGFLGTAANGVPRAVRRVSARLTPATAHAITRSSVEERYMWQPTIGAKLGNACRDLLRAEGDGSKVLASMNRRLGRALRGTLSLQRKSC